MSWAASSRVSRPLAAEFTVGVRFGVPLHRLADLGAQCCVTLLIWIRGPRQALMPSSAGVELRWVIRTSGAQGSGLIERLTGIKRGTRALYPKMQVKVPFRQDRWDSRHRLACARAFREVPFYREQWAYAGRELPEPLPVRAAELQQELFRLCPLRSPWDPRREPTLWTGDPGALSDALTVAGTAPRRVPVLEVRGAAVDWARVGRYGRRMGSCCALMPMWPATAVAWRCTSQR